MDIMSQMKAAISGGTPEVQSRSTKDFRKGTADAFMSPMLVALQTGTLSVTSESRPLPLDHQTLWQFGL